MIRNAMYHHSQIHFRPKTFSSWSEGTVNTLFVDTMMISLFGSTLSSGTCSSKAPGPEMSRRSILVVLYTPAGSANRLRGFQTSDP